MSNNCDFDRYRDPGKSETYVLGKAREIEKDHFPLNVNR